MTTSAGIRRLKPLVYLGPKALAQWQRLGLDGVPENEVRRWIKAGGVQPNGLSGYIDSPDGGIALPTSAGRER